MIAGIGPEFTIDTTKPFTVSNTFVMQGENLTSFVNIYQENTVVQSPTFDATPMKDAMSKGMVLIFSYWGSETMGWLDR